MKKDYLNEVKKQIVPILIAGLGGFLITVGNSLIGDGATCVIEATKPEQAGVVGAGLKVVHSSIKSFFRV